MIFYTFRIAWILLCILYTATLIWKSRKVTVIVILIQATWFIFSCNWSITEKNKPLLIQAVYGHDFWAIFDYYLMQVVRYHSLVVDAESLPKELIPVAWTTSAESPYLETLQSDDIPDTYESQSRQKILLNNISTQLKNGSYRPSVYSNRTRSREVIMGIMHSTRPHYGVQVCCNLLFLYYLVCLSVTVCVCWFLFYFLCSIFLTHFWVQFHPESIATRHGRKIFRNFREITEDYWLRLRSPFINERNVHYTGKDLFNIFNGPSCLVIFYSLHTPFLSFHAYIHMG